MAQNNDTYSVLQVIQKAADIYYKYFNELLIVSIINIGLVNIIQLQTNSPNQLLVLVSMILLLLVFDLGNATVMIMINNYYRGLSPGLKGIRDALNNGYRKLFRILGISTLTFSLFFSGFMLFVIPGLYLFCMLLFSNSIAAIEDSDIDPLNLSYQLVKDDFYRVFISGLIAYAAIIVPIALMYFVQINPALSIITPVRWLVAGMHVILWPFYMCILVVSYLEMKQLKREIIPQVINKTLGTPMGCLLAFISVVIAFVLMRVLFNYSQSIK